LPNADGWALARLTSSQKTFLSTSSELIR
jgi:hypothetical protein